jgi:hypothetical protein
MPHLRALRLVIKGAELQLSDSGLFAEQALHVMEHKLEFLITIHVPGDLIKIILGEA